MKIAMTLLLVSAAILSYAQQGDPTWWYSPAGGWKGNGTGKIEVDVGGKSKEYEVNEDGTSQGLDDAIQSAIKINNIPLEYAYRAIKESLVAQVQVNNMAGRLESLFAGGDAGYEASGGGSSTGSFSFDFSDGKVSLNLSGITGVSAGGGLEKSGNSLAVRNWSDRSTSWTLAEQLVRTVTGGNAYLEVLARIPGGGGIAYIPIGMGIGGGGGGSREPDNLTISTNEVTGRLELKRWSTEGSQAADGFAVPYSDNADSGLKWQSFGGFFSSDQFDFNDDESGVVRLKGWASDLSPLHYFGTGDAAGTYGFFAVPTVSVDNVSVVLDSNGRVALPGLENAHDGDVLTYDGSKVAWKEGGEAASDSADGASVSTNGLGKLSIFGFDGAEEGEFPVVGSSGKVEWASTNAFTSSKFNGSFSYFGGQIHDGCVMVGRTPLLVTGISATSGKYRIKIILGSPSTATLEQGDGFVAPSGPTNYIPVYTLSEGDIVEDFRGGFVVPAWE